MRQFGFIGLLTIAFSSCDDSVIQKRVYTEKDIEGYWATNAAIQNSQWTVAIAENSGKNVQSTFLRLYNEACCRPDTVYKVSNDTLFFPVFNLERRAYDFEPEFRIIFLSIERLVLQELDGGEEVTYYSLMTIPASGETLGTVKLFGMEGIEHCEFNSDSIHYSLQLEVSMCPRPSAVYDEQMCSSWFSRLQNLYARITSDEILFARNRKLRIVDVYEDAVLYEPMMRTFTMEMTGSRGLERVDDCGNVVNPVLRALHWEVFQAMQSY
jgi:hypothetical protein